MNTHIILCFILMIMLCVAIYYIATRRGQDRTEFLLISLFCSFIMVFAFFFEVTATDIHVAKKALYAQFVGYTPFSVFYTIESFRACGYKINKNYIILGVLYSFVVIMTVLTNDNHKLYYNEFYYIGTLKGNYILEYNKGILGLINSYVIYIFIVISMLNVLVHYSKWSSALKKQLNYFVSGIAIGTLIYTLNIVGIIRSDYIIVYYIFSGSILVYIFGLYKMGTLDIEALATNMSIKAMSTPMIILDKRWNYVSSNGAGKKRFPELDKLIQGDSIKGIKLLPSKIKYHLKDGTYEFSFTENTQTIYMQVSVNDILSKGKEIGHVLTFTDITEIKNNLIEAETVAYTDTLTKIFNRRGLFKDLDKLSNEELKSTGILMVDIDHFKKVNDTYGHDIGDKVLVKLCEILKTSVSCSDIVARYGGEEFIVAMTNSSLKYILEKAEEIRKVVEKYCFEIIGNITISIGVCMYDEKDVREKWIKKADEALYAAKKSSRNAVFYYDNYNSQIKPYKINKQIIVVNRDFEELNKLLLLIPLKIVIWSKSKEVVFASNSFLEMLKTDYKTYSENPSLHDAKTQVNNKLSSEIILEYFKIAKDEVVKTNWNYITSQGENIYTKVLMTNINYLGKDMIIMYIEN